MLVLGLTLAQVVLMGGSAYFAFVRGYSYLPALVAVLGLSCGLAVGIVDRNPLIIGEAAAGLAAWAVFGWWNGRGKRRKRASKELGDESRQLRDGLVRRMRQRRVTRPGWSPSPSPSR
jgi:hypothetical protein